MWDLRFRPPVVLSKSRKSAIFFAAGAGEFNWFIIFFAGMTPTSVSLHKQISIQISYIRYISRINDLVEIIGALGESNYRFP